MIDGIDAEILRFSRRTPEPRTPRSPDRSAWRPRRSSSGSASSRSGRHRGLHRAGSIRTRSACRCSPSSSCAPTSGRARRDAETHRRDPGGPRGPPRRGGGLLPREGARGRHRSARPAPARKARPIRTIISTRTTIVLGTVKEERSFRSSGRGRARRGGAGPCLRRARPAERRSPRGSRSSRRSPRSTCCGARRIWGSASRSRRFRRSSRRGSFRRGRRPLRVGALARREATPTRREWGGAAITGALLFVGGTGGVVWAEHFVPSGWRPSSLQPNPCPSCCWRPCAAAADRTGSSSPASPWAQRASSFSGLAPPSREREAGRDCRTICTGPPSASSGWWPSSCTGLTRAAD